MEKKPLSVCIAKKSTCTVYFTTDYKVNWSISLPQNNVIVAKNYVMTASQNFIHCCVPKFEKESKLFNLNSKQS
jgi:hypothetical protein